MIVLQPDSDLGYDIVGRGVTIFLAGPTHRFGTVENEHCKWRSKAIEYLEKLNFNGTIFSPERSDNFVKKFDYDEQIEWEVRHMEMADCIVFWIPRDLDILPAFTTNVEFGMHFRNNDQWIFYGRPDDSVKNRYLDKLWKMYNSESVFNNLEEMLKFVVKKIKE